MNNVVAKIHTIWSFSLGKMLNLDVFRNSGTGKPQSTYFDVAKVYSII